MRNCWYMRKYSIRLFDCRGPLGAIIVDSANGGDGNCSTLMVAQLTQPTNTHVQSETAETITNKRVPALTPTPKGERERERINEATLLLHYHSTFTSQLKGTYFFVVESSVIITLAPQQTVRLLVGITVCE